MSETAPDVFRFPPEFVLFDLEYTSWEGAMARGWSGPNEYREMIQIGAIRATSEGLRETDHFLEYVKPVKNPELSDFIVELTGITQQDIEAKGKSFPDALKDFLEFVGDSPTYCWGSDTEVLEENCSLIGESRTLSRVQFMNLVPRAEPFFRAAGIDVRQFTSGTLIQAFEGQSDRRAHDALNDMRNLLDALRIVAQIEA